MKILLFTIENISEILRLGGGNPGALTVLTNLHEEDNSFDFTFFDNKNIKESKIWIFYKHVCGESIFTMIDYINHLKESEEDIELFIFSKGEKDYVLKFIREHI